MDLGYDNRMVAAKCWAALFAVRDWAAKAEQDLIAAPPPKPEKSWTDLFRRIKENEEDKKRLTAWRPRQIVVGKEVPNTGEPEMFGEDSPERKVVELLCYWKARNYGRMAECLPDTSGPLSKVAGEVREIYGSIILDKFEIEDIVDKGPVITIVKARLWYHRNGDASDSVLEFRLFSQDESGGPAIPGKPRAVWSLTTWPML